MVADLPGAGGGGGVAGGDAARRSSARRVRSRPAAMATSARYRSGAATSSGACHRPWSSRVAPIAVSAAVSRRAVSGGGDWKRRARLDRGVQRGQRERADRGQDPGGDRGRGQVGPRGTGRCGGRCRRGRGWEPEGGRGAGAAEVVLARAGAAGEFGGQVGRTAAGATPRPSAPGPVRQGAGGDPVAGGDHHRRAAGCPARPW